MAAKRTSALVDREAADDPQLRFGLDETPSGWAVLNVREQRFLLGYCAHGNAARAAREAGYSEKADKQVGQKLLTRTDLLRVLHQMSHKLGCSLENKIVRQEQLAVAMTGIALDADRDAKDRIAAARCAATHDALLAGLRGQLKLRAAVQGDTLGAGPTDFQYTPAEQAKVREQWRLVSREPEPQTMEAELVN